jgi:hypothetical protein
VQWLERDYQYMTMSHRGDIPVLEDSRRLIGGGGHMLWWDRDAEGEVIPSVGHAQPMFMLKNDEGWAQPMRWDAREGPNLPGEETLTVGQADEDRPEHYPRWLQWHYQECSLPIPASVQAWCDADDAARAERDRIANERYTRQRQRQAEASRAILDEQFRLTDEALDRVAEALRGSNVITTTTAEDSSST